MVEIIIRLSVSSCSCCRNPLSSLYFLYPNTARYLFTVAVLKSIFLFIFVAFLFPLHIDNACNLH